MPPGLVEQARVAAFLERGTTLREFIKLTGAPVAHAAAALKALGREVVCDWEPFKGEGGEPVQVGRYRRRPAKL